jgi:thiol:disulfide interchange protein
MGRRAARGKQQTTRWSRRLKEGLNFLVRFVKLCILTEMKIRGRVIIVVATGLAVGAAVLLWQRGQPRREAVLTVSKLADALANQHGADLLNIVVLPTAIRSQTPGEQQEFLAKALSDEISPAGVLALKQYAQFGLAKSIFPDEYASWCQQAGVDADNCVGFKMERAGIRAEILLVHEGQNYRVVRCKDVKQMAGVN